MDMASRDSYIAAHILVRQAAQMLVGGTGNHVVLSQRCSTCNGQHGKPFIDKWPDVHVSLSHSAHSVAAAASDASVGVDIESWDKVRYGELREARVFAPKEKIWIDSLPTEERDRAALRLWVRKECLIKLGRFTLDSLSECDLISSPPHDLIFRDWDHASSRSSGAVASAGPASLRFLD